MPIDVDVDGVPRDNRSVALLVDISNSDTGYRKQRLTGRNKLLPKIEQSVLYHAQSKGPFRHAHRK